MRIGLSVPSARSAEKIALLEAGEVDEPTLDPVKGANIRVGLQAAAR
jgi:hypothetical protein